MCSAREITHHWLNMDRLQIVVLTRQSWQLSARIFLGFWFALFRFRCMRGTMHPSHVTLLTQLIKISRLGSDEKKRSGAHLKGRDLL